MTSEMVFDPQVKISKKALERSSRFRDFKQDQGIDAVIFDTLFPDTRVYFNKQGEITCLTQDVNLKPDPDWLTYDFTAQEITLVSGGTGLSKFHVVKVGRGYEIILSTLKPAIGIVQGNDLTLVKESVDNPQISVCVRTDSIVVSASTEVVTELSKDICAYTDNKVLSFYVTLKDNPHYMVYNFYVPLRDLANKGNVKIPMEDNFSLNSIYTKPVFDSYGRV